MCFRRAFVVAVVTTPAPRDSPDRSCVASASTPSTTAAARGFHLRLDRAALAVGQIADLQQRIDEEAKAEFGRQPSGARCAAHRRGRAASRSAMTLRTEAGDSVIGMRREILREPTGSPVARYDSTICRKISRERSSSCARPSEGDPDASNFMGPDGFHGFHSICASQSALSQVLPLTRRFSLLER